ncbi:cystathionine gamma-synthase [Alicyclobacillus contaminans]|uniref:trans-sulfuration enzyme family protein n=1 Tax=Alicyclobacillus contaminans TaxID=392016 RepID=UPI000402963A|nr:PLP-dependent transferase [Alicyclobacillus contaminans]GMA50647.1 cystathionine gamma-synthase [Alicyclobacillus contaminans]
MRPDTLALHTGVEFCPHTGAASVPIYQTSTFHWSDLDQPPDFDYARSGNPTRAALERAVAELEGARHGFAFSSGMAAITGALLTLPAGSHVIACEDVYGGSYRALTQVFRRLSIETTFVDATDLDQIAHAIRPNSRALYLETPSNPNLRITDLSGAIQIAKAHGLMTIVDNTFMSPYLQNPHQFGADVVVHSATKFIGGHSDVIAGVATCQDDALASEIYLIQNGFGAVLGPHDSWLLLRGLKTLPLRMRQSQESAARIAAYLQQHPKVQRVFYPGLPDHPGADIHRRQARGPGAVLSFDIGGANEVREFSKRLRLPLFAVSLGAAETILSYPARMSHAAMPQSQRDHLGISDGLLRLSVGVEAVEDLLEDLDSALHAL